jgi:hypothetical protein
MMQSRISIDAAFDQLFAERGPLTFEDRLIATERELRDRLLDSTAQPVTYFYAEHLWGNRCPWPIRGFRTCGLAVASSSLTDGINQHSIRVCGGEFAYRDPAFPDSRQADDLSAVQNATAPAT